MSGSREVEKYGSPRQGCNLHLTAIAICYEERSEDTQNGKNVSKVKVVSFNKPTYVCDIYLTAFSRPGGYDVYMIASNMPKAQKATSHCKTNFCHFS